MKANLMSLLGITMCKISPQLLRPKATRTAHLFAWSSGSGEWRQVVSCALGGGVILEMGRSSQS